MAKQVGKLGGLSGEKMTKSLYKTLMETAFLYPQPPAIASIVCVLRVRSAAYTQRVLQSGKIEEKG